MSLFSCDTNRSFDIHAGTFDVQNCNITTSTDQSSIMVECRFAVNSKALSGIVLIEDERDEEMRDVKLNVKHGNNMKSANITDLPTGNYKASVFDDMEDNQPAYQYPKFLKIVAHSPTPTPSTTVVHTGMIVVYTLLFIVIITLLDIPFTESTSVNTSKSSNVTVTSTPPPLPPVVKSLCYII